MGGTREGGLEAADTIKARDPNFYKKIGAMGGKKGRTGGYYRNSELARACGTLGGRMSKRGKSRKPLPTPDEITVYKQKIRAEYARAT